MVITEDIIGVSVGVVGSDDVYTSAIQWVYPVCIVNISAQQTTKHSLLRQRAVIHQQPNDDKDET